ncbi:pentapeptide repeat-containing protein [Streptomyces coeruleorubidus]
MWIVLPTAFLVAVSVAVGTFYAGWNIIGARNVKSEPTIDSKTLFELVKLAFGVVAGAGALVALVVAYRRQRVDEDAALRDATRLHNERFGNAVAQLGDASPAVRLGGVYALAALADDAPARMLRQTCIDVLCAYLRMPYNPDESPAERQVRHTILRVIRDHLNPHQGVPWKGYDFDFSGATFDGGDLSQAVFEGGLVSFRGAKFVAGDFHFNHCLISSCYINLTEAEFVGGRIYMQFANFQRGGLYFSRARFDGATLSTAQSIFHEDCSTQFMYTEFASGIVNFGDAIFKSSESLEFNEAVFSGGSVNFLSVRGPPRRAC